MVLLFDYGHLGEFENLNLGPKWVLITFLFLYVLELKAY